MQLKYLLLFAIFSFFLFSCDSGLKFNNPLENSHGGNDAEIQDMDSDEPADTDDPGDTEPTDSGDSEPLDSGDSEPTDSGDSEPTDSGDSEPTDSGDSELSDSGDSEPTDSGDSQPDEEPATDEEQAADEDTTPAADEEPVTDEDTTPAADEEPVADEDTTPAPDEEPSADEDTAPAPDDEQPATGQENCSGNSDCRTALGESCDPETHECVQATNCYAAIQSLPHGGFYDWDDGTPQGFQTNNYWNVNDKLSKSGNYSYGRYDENMNYSANMDFISLLADCDPADAGCYSGDLSACSACTVNVTFYHAGKIGDSTGAVRDYIHPVCNGTGSKDVKNSTNLLNSSTHVPQSHWSYAQFHNMFWNYSYNFTNPLKWQMDSSCLTDKFVFGMRFWSNSSGQSAGLVADDLKIAPADSESPVGKIVLVDSEKISGWACDPDRDDYLMVQLRYYKNGDKTQAPVVKNIPANLNVTGAISCSTSAHGFAINHSAELLNALGTGTHAVEVYAFDLHATKNNCGSGYVKIAESSFEITSASSQH